MKNIIKLLLSFVIIFLNSCGDGRCLCSTNTHDAPILTVTYPSQYPSKVASTIYVVINNISNVNARNLSYSIVNNTTGGTINIISSSSTLCRSIAKNDSCTLQVSLGSDTNPGSFIVLISSQSTSQNLFTRTKQVAGLQAIKTLMATIGLTNLPTNTDSGANGITLLYPAYVMNNPKGATQVMIAAIVNSATAGTFNTINLTTSNGTLLNFNVLSANSGSGMNNLSQGSIVSFLVTIPASASQLPIYVQTAVNGTTVNQGITQNLIQLTGVGVGILSILPSNTSLNASYESQIFTLVNTGAGSISGLSIALASSVISGTNNCSSALRAGSSCTYVVDFNASQVVDASSTNITASYNNGSTTASAAAQIIYAGVNPVSGLTITSGANPSFNFATTTNTAQSSQITITNTANNNESNISFNLPSYFTLSAGNSKSCALSGNAAITNILAPAASCNLTLTYQNSSPINSTTAQLRASYFYDGGIDAATSNVALTYSTTQAAAILGISPISYIFPNISADGIASAVKTFTVTNLGDNIATNVTSSISGANSSLFSMTTNNCGSSIAANGSCAIVVQDGPTSTIISGATAALNVSYLPYAAASTVVESASLTATTTQAYNISVQSIAVSNSSGGDGSSTNPWQLPPNSSQTITITYINSGTANAANFTVNTNSLSSGYTLNMGLTTCTSFNLQANSANTCQVVLNIATSTSGEQDLFLSNITYTWNGETTAQVTSWNSEAYSYLSIYQSPLITFVTSGLSNNNIVIGNSFSLMATLTGGYNIVNQTISIQSLTPNSESITSTPNSCIISSAVTSCSLIINISNSTQPESYILFMQSGPNAITLSNESINFNVLTNYAYVSNYGNSAVSICVINGNGSLSNCSSVTPSLQGPNGIAGAINSFYIADYNSNQITICPIYINGTIGNCAADSQSFPGAANPATANGYLYVPNNANSSLSSCPINSDGSLGQCSVSSFSGTPNSVAIANGYAYVLLNGNSSTIEICLIQGDGTLGTCTGGQGFSGQNSIYIYNSVAYIAGNSSVYTCPVTIGGIGSCSINQPTSGSYGNPNTIVIGNNGYAYIDDYGASKVYYCSLQTNGNINVCAITGSGFNRPNGVIATRGTQ